MALRGSRAVAKKCIIGLGLGWLAGLCLVFFGCGEANQNSAGVESDLLASRPADASWKDPQSCRECHEAEYQAWLKSHHAIANRLVDADVDAKAFATREVATRSGRNYTVSSEAGELKISPSSADRELGEPDAVAKMAIGEYPLRQYLVEGKRGRLQTHSLSYDPEKDEWFNVFGAERRRPGEWGHWNGQGMNWNSNCAYCHMTEYDKNYDVALDRYDSTWTHQSVSCIACHTGLEDHATSAAAGIASAGAAMDRSLHMENCASCHARRAEITSDDFEAGERFHDHYRLLLADHPTAYFHGGQANEENYVYGSLMMSGMGEAGVNCMDCHDPHSHQLILPTEQNQLCMQCHDTGARGASIIDAVQHGGHAVGSAGNSCIECHMPERVYMDRDARRDHGFTFPDPYLTRQYGTPNACANCHSEETPEWMEAGFEKIFGDSPQRVLAVRERAAVIEQVRRGEVTDPTVILEQLENTTNPHWRASWLEMLAPFAQDPRVQRVAERDMGAELALLRLAALDIIDRQRVGQGKSPLSIEDEARVVRVHGMDTFVGYAERSEEWQDYARGLGDRPAGALRLAEWATAEGRSDDAVRHVERAISQDRFTAAVRYDAALLLDRAGRPREALKHLKVAVTLEPQNAFNYHALGLIQAELEDYTAAARAFRSALQLDAGQDRWWYSLAIAETRAGDVQAARQSLVSALRLDPNNADYRAFAQQLGLRFSDPGQQ